MEKHTITDKELCIKTGFFTPYFSIDHWILFVFEGFHRNFSSYIHSNSNSCVSSTADLKLLWADEGGQAL